MNTLQLAVLVVHVAGAAIWVGGSVALGLVATSLDRESDPANSDRISKLARRLGWVLWPALLLTVATGVANFRWKFAPGSDWLSTAPGPWFAAKFVSVAILLIAAGSHSFVVAPRIRNLRRSGRAPDEYLPLRRLSGFLGVVSTGAGMATLSLAVVAGNV